MRLILFILFSVHVGIAMADETVNAIVFQSIEEDHIGFTLFHPDFAANEGDCVFVISPSNPDLLDSNQVITLLKIKELGEHQWVRKGNEVIITFGGMQILKMRENGTLVHLPSGAELGIWFPAPAIQ